MRSNRASKTGIQLEMFRKQLTKQFRGLSIIHTVEQCEGSNFSSGSQWLNLVRDEVILRKVNDPDRMRLLNNETVELLGLTLSKDLSWKHDVTSMAKSAAQRTGLLRRVAPYLLPTQRAMIYKAIIRSKMEYASSAWFGATPTSLSQLDAVQRRAIASMRLSSNQDRGWLQAPYIFFPWVF